MTDATRHFKQLTEAEALTALYIDFEGRKVGAPALLGVLRRPGRGETPFVHQDVIDEAFASVATTTLTLRDAIEKVVRRAESRKVRVVAWSEHELKVVRTLRDDDPDLVARFEARFANAHRIAERWRNKLHGGDKPESGRLGDYLALIGYDIPGDATGGEVGDTIGLIRDRFARGLPPTDKQRAAWARVVEHNRHDCAGMRRICILATRELEQADRERSRPPGSV